MWVSKKPDGAQRRKQAVSCHTETSSITVPELIAPEGRDSSESSDNDRNSDNEEADSTIPTPLSPISSKQSPRWPSELKTKRCSYADCQKSFNRQARLNEHLRSHTNDRVFKCPHSACMKDFLRDTHLKHHIKSAHSDIRDYVCSYDGCGKSFATGTRLKRHYAAHEGRDKYRCQIPSCGQAFRKHGTLQTHITSIHEGRDPFICDEPDHNGKSCAAGFDTAGKLKTHKGRAHGGDRFSCTICSSIVDLEGSCADQESTTFPTYAALTLHTKTIHPPTCNQCGLQCTTSHSLKTHIEVQHGSSLVTDRKTHACMEPACGRSFTKKGNLMVHLKTVHAEEKAFVCGDISSNSLNNVPSWNGANACGRAFATKVNLEGHIRTAHLGLPRSRKHHLPTSIADGDPTPASKARTKKSSAVSRLTGTAYTDDPSRSIPCLHPSCPFRFSREYDVEMHLQAKHGMADFEIQLLRASSGAGGDEDGLETRGGYAPRYQIGSDRTLVTGFADDTRNTLVDFGGVGTERDAADLEAEEALDRDFGINGPLHQTARHSRVELQAIGDEGAGDAKCSSKMKEALEEAATRGGAFWVGGCEDGYRVGDEWDDDEAEMRMLIGGGGDEEDAEDEEMGGVGVLEPGESMAIDPLLL